MEQQACGRDWDYACLSEFSNRII